MCFWFLPSVDKKRGKYEFPFVFLWLHFRWIYKDKKGREICDELKLLILQFNKIIFHVHFVKLLWLDAFISSHVDCRMSDDCCNFQFNILHFITFMTLFSTHIAYSSALGSSTTQLCTTIYKWIVLMNEPKERKRATNKNSSRLSDTERKEKKKLQVIVV